MEHLKIENIHALESGPVCIRNYLNYLCLKDARVRSLFQKNNKKLKEDLAVLRETLEIDRWVSPLEFARRIKEYGLLSEMIITDAKDISKYKSEFPLFACLVNDDNENVLLYVTDVNQYGIVVKDINYNDMLIDLKEFERLFSKRMIVIKDYSGFIKKYGSDRMLNALANNKDYNSDVADGLEIVGGIVLTILDVFLS